MNIELYSRCNGESWYHPSPPSPSPPSPSPPHPTNTNPHLLSQLDVALHILGAHSSMSLTTVRPVFTVQPQYTGRVDFPIFAPTC